MKIVDKNTKPIWPRFGLISEPDKKGFFTYIKIKHTDNKDYLTKIIYTNTKERKDTIVNFKKTVKNAIEHIIVDTNAVDLKGNKLFELIK